MVLELTSKRVDTCLHFSRVEISMDLAASLSAHLVWINFKNEKEKTRLNHRVFNFFDCNFMNESILIKRTNERTKRSHSDLRSRKSLTWYPPSYAKTRARRPACRQGSEDNPALKDARHCRRHHTSGLRRRSIISGY